jgi:hypothetical protein
MQKFKIKYKWLRITKIIFKKKKKKKVGALTFSNLKYFAQVQCLRQCAADRSVAMQII